ncbi:hypothetical protein ACF2JD_09425 [Aeromonas sp. A-5]|uniref:hypothetical protein n=1 Tax=Aeromonas ichthyocola TaxID=3367746 RepID=UPI0038EA7FC0
MRSITSLCYGWSDRRSRYQQQQATRTIGSSADDGNAPATLSPVLLLEQRLRKEAERRPLLKVEEPW